jgi:4-alpha-glucanotransferase
MQDVLSLGSEARFNAPGKPQGNWQWRARSAQIEQLITGGTAAYLKSLGAMYGR